MRQKRLYSLGYTVIELLAVAGIIVILGSLVTGILYSTLRGSNKTTITTAVAQNGNYALTAIVEIIISSDFVSSVDGASYDNCVTPLTGSSSITLERIDGGTTTLKCENDTISSNSASLVDATRVKVSSCSFKCSQLNRYSKPLIEVDFTLTDKGGGLFESKSSSDFKTAATLRNYKPD